MLEIKNLHASIGGKEILKGINLTIPSGQVHAIMGPNGSGKSTLSYVLSGRDGYDVTAGTALFDGKDLLSLKTEERAAAGVFLAMQYPVEIPGVTNMMFLKTSLNAIRKSRGESELDAMQMLKLLRSKAKEIGLSEEMLKRSVNVGFSGGEKKRNEILQMAVLEPALCLLDETDSGLDIDALKIVSEGVNALRSPKRSMIVITHYQRLLDYIKPDAVHVLAHGKIQKTGGPDLAKELELKGYADFGIRGCMSRLKDNLIVFDWNGTILADTSACLKATNTVLNKLGLPKASMQQYRHHYTMPIDKLYHALGIGPELIAQHGPIIHPLWHEVYGATNIRLRRGAKTMLHAVQSYQCRMIVLSNYLVQRIDEQARKLHIREYFEDIIAFEVGNPVSRRTSKGSRLKEYLKAHPFKVGIIIGDSEEEIEIGRELGMATIAITEGMCSTTRLRAMRPTFLVRSLAEVPRIAHQIFLNQALVSS